MNYRIEIFIAYDDTIGYTLDRTNDPADNDLDIYTTLDGAKRALEKALRKISRSALDTILLVRTIQPSLIDVAELDA